MSDRYEPPAPEGAAERTRLRDYFAARALQGLLSNPHYECGKETSAQDAYRHADAMLKARETVSALRAALAEPVETVGKTPAWWMDGLTATLMREGVNKHRAKEIAKGYWEAYCQVPMDEEQPR